MDDDLERPGLPVWVIAVIGLLAVLGALSILRWFFGALFGLVKVAILVAIIALVVMAVRSRARR